MPNSIICFENISKSYGNNLILKDFNLKINKGEFVTIIGSSGSGKTTALKLINGLIEPDEGTLYVNKKDISKVNQNMLRRNIGYVIQGVGLFPHMNIRKNISYVLNLTNNHTKIEINKRVKNLISLVGMEDEILERYPNELSGGQRQRIGIARALAANPSILLMDEPFGAVDEITRKTLQDEIKKVHRELKVTIIFITHDVREAFKLGTKVVVMDSGKIVQMGNPKDIISTPKNDFVKNLIVDL